MSKKQTNKLYACKNEELPVVASFVALSFKRDLADFAAYSHLFSDEYRAEFEKEVETAKGIMNGATAEKSALKTATKKLHDTMDALLPSLKRISGYVKLGNRKGSVDVPAKDFGLDRLAQKLRSRDAEGVSSALLTVKENLVKYADALKDVGMGGELPAAVASAIPVIHDLNSEQYKQFSERGLHVVKNVEIFNTLYVRLREVMDVGKIIYTDDAKKLGEYTFSRLLKRVRVVRTSATETPTAPVEAGTEEAGDAKQNS
jgi:hypothetical protein